MCKTIVEFEAVSNMLALIIERCSKDVNELNSDYLEYFFNATISEFKKINPVDYKSITLDNSKSSFQFVKVAGSWKILSSLMRMEQK
jgi:hypothetical protein